MRIINDPFFLNWLSCHTQQEIAEQVGMTRTAVEMKLTKMAELPKLSKLSADHSDFEPPIYNILIKFYKNRQHCQKL
jgi:hypothetical protein